MARLIKEDDVMKMLTDVELSSNIIPITEAKTRLRYIPTAYDVDKVVEELKEASYDETQDDMNPFPPSKVVSLRKAEDIVRKGGVNENNN